MNESEIEREAADACKAAAMYFAASDVEAMQIRNRLVALGWPRSRAVGQRLPGGDTHPMAAASHARSARLLLGVWAGQEYDGFLHPTFQFCADGTIQPHLADVLAILATVTRLSPTGDPSGWERLFWFYQSRGTLSKRSLALHATPPVEVCSAPDKFMTMSNDARSPAEVFGEHSEAVIALAEADACVCVLAKGTPSPTGTS